MQKTIEALLTNKTTRSPAKATALLHRELSVGAVWFSRVTLSLPSSK